MPVTPVPAMTPPPKVPVRGDRINFAADAQVWTLWEKNAAYSDRIAVANCVYDNALLTQSWATAAARSEQLALAAATQAQQQASTALTAPGTQATSVTRLDVGAGARSLVVQAGKSISVGQFLMLASAANPAVYMVGQVTAYNAGTGALDIAVQQWAGAGQAADWVVSLTAIAGVTTTGVATLSNKTYVAPKEVAVALVANDIDLSLASVYSKTIAANTTLTVSNLPPAGTVTSFTLEITNGGAAVVTWWAGIKWSGGSAPGLTANGLDVLEFYTRDGGATWRGFRAGKDMR